MIEKKENEQIAELVRLYDEACDIIINNHLKETGIKIINKSDDAAMRERQIRPRAVRL